MNKNIDVDKIMSYLLVMREDYSLDYVIEWAIEQSGEYPLRPIKSKLNPNSNSTQVKEYALELEEWEKLDEEYLIKRAEWQRNEKKIIDNLVILIKNEVAFERVPEQ